MVNPLIKIYESLTSTMSEKSIREFVEALDEHTAARIELLSKDLVKRGEFDELNKNLGKLRSDMYKAVYITTLSQIVAIVAAVVLIVNGMK